MLQANTIPELLQIELTYQCNLNCVFCYNPLRAKTFSIEDIDRLVKRISEFKIPQIYLIGGEPSVLGVKKLNEYIDLLSKTSSVTIVTNGFIKLEGISTKLANIAVSLHGYDAKSHEAFNGVKGSFERAIASIRYYKTLGINVRCVTVLSGENYSFIGKILKRAINAGVDEIYIDRYEDGGIGATNSSKINLKPTNQQFREALSQIIEVRNSGLLAPEKIAFGTAIPFCVDERMFAENLLSSCSAGTNFCAITPTGDLRLCNQSNKVYGNVFKEDIDVIWANSRTEDYRCMKWTQPPCSLCKLLSVCQAGCRVDANSLCAYCIDYALRDNLDETIKCNIERINAGELIPQSPYQNSRLKSAIRRKIDFKSDLFASDRFLRVNEYKSTFYMVTQFQGVQIGKDEFEFLEFILSKKHFTCSELFDVLDVYEEKSIEDFVQLLLFLGAIRKLN